MRVGPAAAAARASAQSPVRGCCASVTRLIDQAYKTPTGALNQGWRGAPRALARVEPNQKHTPCSSQDRGRGVTCLLLTEMLLFLIENAGYAGYV